uniref:Uncharacterized protein MANES_13G131600 n=1 Tax=Rhizophora mucronata TaxID=61149 RepID=A0A2P2MKF2_RHIMU
MFPLSIASSVTRRASPSGSSAWITSALASLTGPRLPSKLKSAASM